MTSIYGLISAIIKEFIYILITFANRLSGKMRLPEKLFAIQFIARREIDVRHA